jgi:biotin carboxyl carrier protein
MGRIFTLRFDSREEEVEVNPEEDGFAITIGGREHHLSLGTIDEGRLYSVLMDGASYEVHALPAPGSYDLLVRNEHFHIDVRSGKAPAAADRPGADTGSWTLLSPMTGIVADVLVTAGDSVERGSVLLILESMKMKNELRSARVGVVERVRISPGDRVERGQELIVVRS